MLNNQKFQLLLQTMLLLLLALPFSGRAQMTPLSTERSSVSGIVLEKGVNQRIGDVNVLNLTNQKTARTNAYGVFFIPASVGDSLSFSKTGYGTVKTMLYALDDILIDMQAGLTIETVIVNRMSREAEMESYMRDYQKKGIYNGGKNSVGTYLNSPATALYNLFGQEAKNAKRFAQYMELELDETKVDRVFNKTSVSQLIGLTGDELQSFMDLFRPSAMMVERWGQYDFMNYVKKSFDTWEKQGRPKSTRLPKLELPPQEK